MWQQVVEYAAGIDLLELAGLVFGLLAVWFLIRQNILTWPSGIIYIFISFVIFWRARLYGDFILHIFFLVLNVYGWYYWLRGRHNSREELPVTVFSLQANLLIALLTGLSVWGFGLLLRHLPDYFSGLDAAALPFWDAATTMMSVTAMWLTTRKKLENWYYWLLVDILATGIYAYKGIYFYALLYGVYIVMALSGLLAWKKSMQKR